MSKVGPAIAKSPALVSHDFWSILLITVIPSLYTCILLVYICIHIIINIYISLYIIIYNIWSIVHVGQLNSQFSCFNVFQWVRCNYLPKASKGYIESTCLTALSITYHWRLFSPVISWLVVSTNPSKKYAKVSWDYDIPNWMESHKIPWFQTTNQYPISNSC